MVRTTSIAACLLIGLATAGPAAAQATGPAPAAVVAKVDGHVITEADVKLADAEIGGDVGGIPESAKRRVLIEYLVENQVLADAAEGAKLGSGPEFEQRLAYWRRRALRDSYYATVVESAASDADARALYDTQVASMPEQQEVHARHILVETQQQAKEIYDKISYGADFAAMAKQFSKDPGSKDDGGDLGFFGRGQMVPQFEETAFKLDKGGISLPFQSQFGWHILQVLDKRVRKPPEFDLVKDRIKAALGQQKAQATVANMRAGANVEYVDPAVRAEVEAEKAAAAKQGKP